jgi:hypothetical protein
MSHSRAGSVSPSARSALVSRLNSRRVGASMTARSRPTPAPRRICIHTRERLVVVFTFSHISVSQAKLVSSRSRAARAAARVARPRPSLQPPGAVRANALATSQNTKRFLL